MSLLGSASEGNIDARDFFEYRNLGSFLILFESQYAWIALVAIGSVTLLIMTSERASRWDNSFRRDHLYFIIVWFLWVFALGRLALGPSTNIAGILDPTTSFASLLEVVFAIVMTFDFLWILRNS